MPNPDTPNERRNSSWTAGTHSSTTVATPPGFVAPAAGLWSENGGISTGNGAVDGSVTLGQQRQERRRNQRTSSFNNIAAALGNGLAESIEDATREDESNNNASGAPANLTDSFFNPSRSNSDITYERHKRHTASRLVGVPGMNGTSHTSSDKNNIGSSNDDSRLAGSLNGSPIGSSPFAHDPTAAAFHPSASSSGLSFNGNPAGDGQLNDHGKSRLAVTKDIGLTVNEPSDFSYGGGRSNIPGTRNLSNFDLNQAANPDSTYGIQSEMKNLWSDSNRGGTQSSNPTPSTNSRAGVESPPQAIEAEGDLRPFTWDINQHETSRTLAIFNAAAIPLNQIEDLCENFGAIENFGSEFWKRVGVVFISYFDMRSVQFAAMQLPRRLQSIQGGSGSVQVKYCIPLNSSSQNDESLVVINDLPNQIGQNNLGSYLSQFGAIRSLNLLAGSYGTYVAEFNDVQDARKVVYELETRQPWGPDVSIEVGSRKPADRKKGRELLALLGRWRNQGGGAGQSAPPANRGRQPSTPDTYRPHVDSRGMGHRDGRYDRGMPHESQLGYGQSSQDGRYAYGGNTYLVHQQQHQHVPYSQYRGSHLPNDMHVNHGHHGTYVTRQMNHQAPPHQQQFYQQPQNMSHGNFPGGGSVISAGSSRHTGASGYYTPDDRSIGSHTSHGSNLRSINSLVDSMAGASRDTQGQNLILDLELVENDLDKRSSLMVRNIPNKYTQQMLLNEFTENGHGPGIIDFFYLPIDFKNRCNRGYAFINFVDYRDIVKFHRQYYGQHWRTFNSDKICDITYARIQTKASMLKRFENSALMEKDEEYKPLVFVSDGPEKGKRLPFAVSSRGS